MQIIFMAAVFRIRAIPECTSFFSLAKGKSRGVCGLLQNVKHIIAYSNDFVKIILCALKVWHSWM